MANKYRTHIGALADLAESLGVDVKELAHNDAWDLWIWVSGDANDGARLAEGVTMDHALRALKLLRVARGRP